MSVMNRPWNYFIVASAAVWALVTFSVTQIHAQGEPGTIKVSGALYTAAQADRGHANFQKYCLNGCHRENMHTGEGDLSLTGPHFLEQWGLVSLGSMAEIIRTTMPEDAPNTLTVKESVDIVAYILWLNYYPAGNKELPANLNTLNKWMLQTPREHLQMFIDMAKKQ